MKIDQLLLAAEVIKLSEKMREGELLKVQRDLDAGNPEHVATVDTWLDGHTISSYTPRSYAFIKKIALQIEEIREQPAD